MHRDPLKAAARVVVKFGTGVLTDSRKQPDPAQLEQLVAQIAAQRQAGREIVIVTSGAVGAGMGALGLEKRPTELAALSACAAVGQSQLMATYAELFTRHGLRVAQVLLTHDDLDRAVLDRCFVQDLERAFTGVMALGPELAHPTLG